MAAIVGAKRPRPGGRGLAAAALALALGPVPAWSQSSPDLGQSAARPAIQSALPMRVTTDTTEYCDILAVRVRRAERELRSRGASGDMEQVQELAAEGRRMCADGLIRGGLVRLRRALVLLRAEK